MKLSNPSGALTGALVILALLLALISVRLDAGQDTRRESAGSEPAVAESSVKSPAEQPRKSSGPLPEDVAGLQQAAVEAYEEGNYLRFVQATIKLRKLRPYEPQYMVGMVVGSALVGRKNTAYNYMHIMQQQGLSYDFNSTEDTRSIRGTEVYNFINDLLIEAGSPMGEGEPAFELPRSNYYPEALAWDESRKRFLVGTLDSGSIYSVSADDKARLLLKPDDENGLRSIHSLAVDGERNRLWVSTTVTPAFEDYNENELGRTALLEFSLDTLELLNRHEPPGDGAPHLLGRIRIGQGGEVYVMDRAVPMLFRKRPDVPALEPFLANPRMVGFSDMALSPDAKRLYLADAAHGIMLVDLASSQAGMLMVPDTLNLSGISGLDASGDSLLMLQSGVKPQRLLRLVLDEAGMAVVDVKPLALALDLFETEVPGPAFGHVRGEQIFYFAGSNLLGPSDKRLKPRVLRSPIELEEDLSTTEQRVLRERTEQSLGKGKTRED